MSMLNAEALRADLRTVHRPCTTSPTVHCRADNIERQILFAYFIRTGNMTAWTFMCMLNAEALRANLCEGALASLSDEPDDLSSGG
jgi:hypothetical protein